MNGTDDELPQDAAPPVPCWRCGLDVAPERPRCPHCAAPQRTEGVADPARKPTFPADESRQLFLVLRGFFAILLVSVLHGAISASAGEKEPRAFHDTLLVVMESLDTVIVLVVWGCLGSARLPGDAPPGRRSIAWMVALPVLAALLAINIGYHGAIRDYVKIDWLKLPEPPGLTAMTVLTVGVQPALVEELFFRFLLIGVLRRHCGVHGTVLVSAVLFAVCHVHVLLSMPYLFLVGVVLGYLRIGSRSMALPVLLHFLHNMAVTWWEENA